MHQNVQCLRNKIDEIEIMLKDELKDVEILCFTEHWLNEKETDLYQISN